MYRLKSVENKTIGIYLRKEQFDENLVSGYGRLQWLKYELEDYKPTLKIYIDEYGKRKNLYEIIKDMKEKSIDVLIIWSLDDIDADMREILISTCVLSNISIISFCEETLIDKEQ
ncbi:hypothetical protein Cp4436_01442 [Clostridium perfringens]|uniref:hypothetical protein n=1 Tax=Clostridium perfringens TaxID=1502 RepID=UPI001D9734D9|nr:hypothetical protein [Clostridium perfringens]EHK2346820.1 hypothetical protein [Clostridium perfringens]MDC4245837.1 hypothetical protein [Clostridium perfringens]MDG6889409.1 hypothetical protein [Clostridium perfringens]